jgi:hypothetical protein
MKVIIRFLIITCLAAAAPKMAYAQCAMCKAKVESNMEGKKAVGKGLNKGILYLMTVPYLVLAGFGYMVYKNWKGK